ncbi:hypothetical protein YN1HA_20950 [Sulfurisphaera ohwakuensis]
MKINARKMILLSIISFDNKKIVKFLEEKNKLTMKLL